MYCRASQSASLLFCPQHVALTMMVASSELSSRRVPVFAIYERTEFSEATVQFSHQLVGNPVARDFEEKRRSEQRYYISMLPRELTRNFSFKKFMVECKFKSSSCSNYLIFHQTSALTSNNTLPSANGTNPIASLKIITSSCPQQ